MDNALDIEYILKAVRRRIWYFIVPFIVIGIVAVSVAVFLPPIYNSSGTILIEAQGIPADFVRSTVTSYIDQRLQTISQIVQSRTNLAKLLQEFNLYQDERDTKTVEELVQQMRENIITNSIEGIDPETGKETLTVAFVVGFQGENPRQVRDVANRLVSMYLEENLRTRTEQAETTYKFLEDRLVLLEKEIQTTEAKLAAFKESHLHTLPELMQLNLTNLERTRDAIDAKQEYLKSLINRQVVLEEQLGLTDPGVIDGSSTEKEIDNLRNQYVALKASLSENHPDVIRLRNQLQSMGAMVDSEGVISAKSEELTAKREELAQAEASYSEKHPDVVRLRKEVAKLEASIADLSEIKELGIPTEEKKPSNPAYLQLIMQINTNQGDIEKEKLALKDLEKKYEMFQQRLEATPRVEQEYLALQRNYNQAQSKYRETLAKLQAASEGVELEEENIAEKMTLIDPPQIPLSPNKPNRKLIALAGMVLAMLAGLGCGIAAEFLDQRVHSAKEVPQLANSPLLAVIPAIKTREDARRKRLRMALIIGLVLGGVIGGLAAAHFLVMPLEDLFSFVIDRFTM